MVTTPPIPGPTMGTKDKANPPPAVRRTNHDAMPPRCWFLLADSPLFLPAPDRSGWWPFPPATALCRQTCHLPKFSRGAARTGDSSFNWLRRATGQNKAGQRKAADKISFTHKRILSVQIILMGEELNQHRASWGSVDLYSNRQEIVGC